MKLERNKAVLTILFLAVVVSGCTGTQGQQQDQPSSTASIQVMEFTAFPNPVPGDQATRFRMQIKNVGGAVANDTFVRLYNPPFADSSSETNTWRDSGGGAVSVAERTLKFGDVSGPGPQTPAVPQTETVQFTAPNLQNNREITYNMNGYITYEYQTEATSEIRIMSGDVYQQRGSPSGSATVDNSRAPVKMEIRTPTPIVLYDVGGGGPPTRDLCVVVRNRGKGIPFNDNPPSTNVFLGPNKGWNLSAVSELRNQVNVNIEDIGRVQFRPKGSSAPFTDTNSAQSVKIIGGKGVQCWEMKIQTGGSSQIQTTVPLSLTANYGYRQSTRTSVTVQGRRN
ncbi:MAG: hypothetical protein ABEJ36_04050 [Candidatus Nanosalina sp.]